MCGVNKVTKFLNQSLDELKKIQWPSKKETLRLTGFVIGVSAVAGLLVMMFDYVFKKFLTYLLTK